MSSFEKNSMKNPANSSIRHYLVDQFAAHHRVLRSAAAGPVCLNASILVRFPTPTSK